MDARESLWFAGQWRDEIDRCEFYGECYDLADCAELADELDIFRIQAESDHNFQK